MRRALIIFTSLLLLTTVYSCRKEIQESDADFIGSWHDKSEEIHIEIDQYGRGSYYSTKGFFAKRNIDNALVHINDDILRIGETMPPFSVIKYKRLKIDQRPTVTPDSTYMILDGITFHRGW